MKIICLVILVLLTGCSVISDKRRYSSGHGENLTLRNNNAFEFNDIIYNGHWDIYVHSKGTYRIKNDTLFFNHITTNADSLYYEGRKFMYILPMYVLKKEMRQLILSKNGDKKILRLSR